MHLRITGIFSREFSSRRRRPTTTTGKAVLSSLRITGKFHAVHRDLDLGYALDMHVDGTEVQLTQCRYLPGDLVTVTKRFFLTDDDGMPRECPTLNPGDVAVVVSLEDDDRNAFYRGVRARLACHLGLVVVHSPVQYFYDHMVRP